MGERNVMLVGLQMEWGSHERGTTLFPVARLWNVCCEKVLNLFRVCTIALRAVQVVQIGARPHLYVLDELLTMRLTVES